MMEGVDHPVFDDRSPGVEEQEPAASVLTYTTGLLFALVLTLASFAVSQTNLL